MAPEPCEVAVLNAMGMNPNYKPAAVEGSSGASPEQEPEAKPQVSEVPEVPEVKRRLNYVLNKEGLLPTHSEVANARLACRFCAAFLLCHHVVERGPGPPLV